MAADRAIARRALRYYGLVGRECDEVMVSPLDKAMRSKVHLNGGKYTMPEDFSTRCKRMSCCEEAIMR